MEDEDRYTRMTLRIPKALHADLQAEADRTSKSLNAEIIARLAGSFEPKSGSAAELARAVSRLDLIQKRESIARQIESGIARLEMHRMRWDFNRHNMSKEDFAKWHKEEGEMKDWLTHMEFNRQLIERDIAAVDGLPLPPVNATL